MIDFKIKHDGYYIATNHLSEFTYEIALRGYQIKSWNKFQHSVGTPDEKIIFKEVTQEEYDLKFYGDWKKNLPEKPQKKTRKKKC